MARADMTLERAKEIACDALFVHTTVTLDIAARTIHAAGPAGRDQLCYYQLARIKAGLQRLKFALDSPSPSVQ